MFMTLSTAARTMAGITLLAVPTIVYGSLAVLAEQSSYDQGLVFTLQQASYFLVGHANAGVLVILSLMLQILLDFAELPEGLRWLARVLAPASAILLAGGYFGIVFIRGLSVLLWLGLLSLSVAMILSGVGLLRRP